MIDFYTWSTPNGHKVAIALEELGLPYRLKPVDIQRGEQFTPEFLAINPNNRIPAIVDHEGPGGPLTLFESGAILIYLAEKTGRFLSSDPRRRYETIVWLMFQMGGVGPMFGQAHHFRFYAPEKIPYAIDRYTKETTRLYNVLNKRLADHEYLAGEYSIADMATFPWTNSYQMQGQAMEDFPHVARWREALKARPAVQKGISLLAEKRREGPPDEKTRENLFGDTQFKPR